LKSSDISEVRSLIGYGDEHKARIARAAYEKAGFRMDRNQKYLATP